MNIYICMETERLALSPHSTVGQREGQDIPSPQHRIWDTANNAYSLVIKGITQFTSSHTHTICIAFTTEFLQTDLNSLIKRMHSQKREGNSSVGYG